MTEDSTFKVSVIIAAWPDAAGLAQCLDSLAAHPHPHPQVIVVGAFSAPAEMARRFPAVQWLTAAADALIPNLWSQGMAAARGEVVAITTGHFIPAPDWLAQMWAAHQRLDAAGIGGAIDPPRGGTAGDWATYFLRYSVLFKLDREQQVDDLAGDNASYKRGAIAAHWESVREGFWEPEFHRRLLAAGERLAFVPAIRVTQSTSFGIRRFCAQRLSHGRHFGRDRMRGRPALFRFAGVVAAPLIPLVLLAKIVRRLIAKPAYAGPFLRSLPVLVMFIVSWALGEVLGYLSAAADDGSSHGAQGRVSA